MVNHTDVKRIGDTVRFLEDVDSPEVFDALFAEGEMQAVQTIRA